MNTEIRWIPLVAVPRNHTGLFDFVPANRSGFQRNRFAGERAAECAGSAGIFAFFLA